MWMQPSDFPKKENPTLRQTDRSRMEKKFCLRYFCLCEASQLRPATTDALSLCGLTHSLFLHLARLPSAKEVMA